jgi:peptidoglycan/xylan/chitin deacetylase (PgdA/CDA1 family)
MAIKSKFIAKVKGLFYAIAPKPHSKRSWIPAALIVICLAIAGYGYFIPSSQIFGKVYYKGDPSQKLVALTFDDGPNDPYTSQILDVLEQDKVQATFFTIGKNAELFPDTIKRMVTDGDVIGNHSYSHSANHALTQYGINDMRKGELAISVIAGVQPKLYRPPHGKLSPWEIHYVHSAGMIEVTWTVETYELAGRSASQEAQDLINKTHPGDILLLHDGYGTEHFDKNADKTLTAQAVSILIPKLQAEGYTFVTLSQLLDVSPYFNVPAESAIQPAQ